LVYSPYAFFKSEEKLGWEREEITLLILLSKKLSITILYVYNPLELIKKIYNEESHTA